MNEIDRKAEERDEGGGAPWLEWIASASGLLIAVALVSFLVWDILGEKGEPPTITVETGKVTPYGGGFTVEIRLRNSSAATAAHVAAEGVLKRGDQIVELARATIDYLPGKSERRGGLFFTHDPREFSMQVRPLGYAQP